MEIDWKRADKLIHSLAITQRVAAETIAAGLVKQLERLTAAPVMVKATLPTPRP